MRRLEPYFVHVWVLLHIRLLWYTGSMWEVPDMSTICRAYIRVSTEEQAVEGYSLEAQMRTLQAVAKEKGWIWGGVYADEGKSGRSMKKRPELRRLMDEIRPGEVLLVWKMDRLNRNLLDSETIQSELDKRGASFYSVSEPHLSSAGPGGKFVRQIMAGVAELYSGMLGENVRHGMAEMVRQGNWAGGPVPYGYGLGPDGGLVINEDRAQVVRQMFTWYLGGLGIRGIAAKLNEMGVRTGNGAVWSSPTVSHILDNPVYTGRVSFGRNFLSGRRQPQVRYVEAPGKHVPILDEETFRTAQEIRTRRKGMNSRAASSKGDYPLTGIAVCGLCGASVSGARYKTNDRRRAESRRMYRCSRRSHTKTCALPIMSSDRLENAFVGAVEALLDPRVMDEMLAAHAVEAPAADMKHLRKQIADIDKRLHRWDQAFENEALSLEDYTDKVKPLREQRKGLLDEIARQEKQQSGFDRGQLRELARTFRHIWQHATAAERKELTHSLCQKVTLHPGYDLELTLRPRA